MEQTRQHPLTEREKKREEKRQRKIAKRERRQQQSRQFLGGWMPWLRRRRDSAEPVAADVPPPTVAVSNTPPRQRDDDRSDGPAAAVPKQSFGLHLREADGRLSAEHLHVSEETTWREVLAWAGCDENTDYFVQGSRAIDLSERVLETGDVKKVRLVKQPSGNLDRPNSQKAAKSGKRRESTPSCFLGCFRPTRSHRASAIKLESAESFAVEVARGLGSQNNCGQSTARAASEARPQSAATMAAGMVEAMSLDPDLPPSRPESRMKRRAPDQVVDQPLRSKTSAKLTRTGAPIMFASPPKDEAKQSAPLAAAQQASVPASKASSSDVKEKSKSSTIKITTSTKKPVDDERIPGNTSAAAMEKKRPEDDMKAKKGGKETVTTGSSGRTSAGTTTSSKTTTRKVVTPNLALAGVKEVTVPCLNEEGDMREIPLVELRKEAIHGGLRNHLSLLQSAERLSAATVNMLMRMTADELGVHFIPLSFCTLASSDSADQRAKAKELLMEEDRRKRSAEIYVLPLFAAVTTGATAATIVIGEHYTFAWYRPGEKEIHYVDSLRQTLDQGSATYKALELWARHVSKNQELNIVYNGTDFPLQTDPWNSGVHVVVNARRVICGPIHMRLVELGWFTNEEIDKLSAEGRRQKFLETRRKFWRSIVSNIQEAIKADARTAARAAARASGSTRRPRAGATADRGAVAAVPIRGAAEQATESADQIEQPSTSAQPARVRQSTRTVPKDRVQDELDELDELDDDATELDEEIFELDEDESMSKQERLLAKIRRVAFPKELISESAWDTIGRTRNTSRKEDREQAEAKVEQCMNDYVDALREQLEETTPTRAQSLRDSTVVTNTQAFRRFALYRLCLDDEAQRVASFEHFDQSRIGPILHGFGRWLADEWIKERTLRVETISGEATTQLDGATVTKNVSHTVGALLSIGLLSFRDRLEQLEGLKMDELNEYLHSNNRFRGLQRKRAFGMRDLFECFTRSGATIKSLDQLQLYVLASISIQTGLRPASLLHEFEETSSPGLKWGDVEFMLRADRILECTIKIVHLKTKGESEEQILHNSQSSPTFLDAPGLLLLWAYASRAVSIDLTAFLRTGDKLSCKDDCKEDLVFRRLNGNTFTEGPVNNYKLLEYMAHLEFVLQVPRGSISMRSFRKAKAIDLCLEYKSRYPNSSIAAILAYLRQANIWESNSAHLYVDELKFVKDKQGRVSCLHVDLAARTNHQSYSRKTPEEWEKFALDNGGVWFHGNAPLVGFPVDSDADFVVATQRHLTDAFEKNLARNDLRPSESAPRTRLQLVESLRALERFLEHQDEPFELHHEPARPGEDRPTDSRSPMDDQSADVDIEALYRDYRRGTLPREVLDEFKAFASICLEKVARDTSATRPAAPR